uniref:Ribonuclease H-like domain-containing protein n=1 Tax=Tanacetum cinerariifolium TaxID=118510 RepID=A0A699GSF0_TANCI|nr:ribonuclease H-like domain-containing protein [Tanacetum cinerariifolium]
MEILPESTLNSSVVGRSIDCLNIGRILQFGSTPPLRFWKRIQALLMESSVPFLNQRIISLRDERNWGENVHVRFWEGLAVWFQCCWKRTLHHQRGNFMPPKPDLSYIGLDEFTVKPVVENKSSDEETKAARKNTDAPIIKEWVSDDEEKNMTPPKIFKKIVKPSIVKKEPKAVVNVVNGNLVNVVKASACWVWKPKTEVIDHVSKHNNASITLKKFDYIDAQGRSKDMSYLTNYEEIDGEYVAFGGNPIGGKLQEKGILRQFSIARTPQQNGVVERRNMILIEAARIMLANSKLPTTFWAEAVNTACYVQNRVLVVKPHNNTPYKLFHDRTPTLSFMRPFGCPVIVLNTKYHLGKFDGKAEEGFFVGYYLNSKAFKVFNSKTRIVEENFHIRFSKSTPNVVGSEPDWLFDIDALTRIMNYEPIVACTQSNSFVDPNSSQDDGFKHSCDDGKKVNEDPRK